jgi:pilus assembly protein CpaB
MKPKTLILMVVAVVCGLGASYMTSRLLAEREDKPAQVAETPRVPVWVAKKYLETSTVLKNPSDLFREKLFVETDAPKEAIKDLALIKGKVLKRFLRAGDHITLEDLNDGEVQIPLPPGYVGVGLRVTIEGSAGGFANLPGSLVDILWNMRGGNEEKTFTKTLLKKVLVVAADQRKDRPDDGGAIPASTVTVALTPHDARKVTLAKDHGTITLVLRKPGDESSTDEKEIISLAELMKETGVKKTAHELDPEPEPEPATKVLTKEPAKAGEPSPEKPRRWHYVYFMQGGRQWVEKFEIDERGNVIHSEIRPVGPQARPQGQPAPQPGQPAPNAGGTPGKKD